MYKSNWNDIDKYLNEIYLDIFKNIEINELDFYTKRKMIFEYLCNNINYDFGLLEKIKLNKLDFSYKVERNPSLEIESVLKHKKGICNAIAQVYKLLLEKVGINSLCVICDDSTDIKHQLNLVYDETTDSFSFDDVTSVIVKRGSIDDFFDYNLEDANKNNQGLKILYEDKKWLCLPDDYINYIVGRNKNNNFKYSNTTELPDNIISLKKQNKKL